jgi:thiazole synthase
MRAIAMELGADGVLMNTAIAGANDPVGMASAMQHAVIAGRLAFLCPAAFPSVRFASASSPVDGLIARPPSRRRDVQVRHPRLQSSVASAS